MNIISDGIVRKHNIVLGSIAANIIRISTVLDFIKTNSKNSIRVSIFSKSGGTRANLGNSRIFFHRRSFGNVKKKSPTIPNCSTGQLHVFGNYYTEIIFKLNLIVKPLTEFKSKLLLLLSQL